LRRTLLAFILAALGHLRWYAALCALTVGAVLVFLYVPAPDWARILIVAAVGSPVLWLALGFRRRDRR
jgi:hypothetical protein